MSIILNGRNIITWAHINSWTSLTGKYVVLEMTRDLHSVVVASFTSTVLVKKFRVINVEFMGFRFGLFYRYISFVLELRGNLLFIQKLHIIFFCSNPDGEEKTSVQWRRGSPASSADVCIKSPNHIYLYYLLCGLIYLLVARFRSHHYNHSYWGWNVVRDFSQIGQKHILTETYNQFSFPISVFHWNGW